MRKTPSHMIGKALRETAYEQKKGELAGKAGKNSYLNRERKVNADFMRKSGHGDILSMRKSIGRHAK